MADDNDEDDKYEEGSFWDVMHNLEKQCEDDKGKFFPFGISTGYFVARGLDETKRCKRSSHKSPPILSVKLIRGAPAANVVCVVAR